MGKVKLPLGSLLFVHGTPLTESIGKAASHACIRMRNADAIALAGLVQASVGATMSDATLDSLLKRWEPSRRVALPVAVPVRVVYELVERRADELLFHPDVYRRGREQVFVRAMALIAAAGYDTARVDRERLERAASDGARSRTAIEIKLVISP
jgi:murein L,D-transpeptidase YcbB/YkuD